MEHTAEDGKVYSTKYYNLDVIISVGYRVNSAQATKFRIWATGVLKNHLIQGYTLNQQRLQQQAHKLQALQRAVKLIGSMKDKKQLEYQEAMGLLEVIDDYNYALGLLHGIIKIPVNSGGIGHNSELNMMFSEFYFLRFSRRPKW